MSYKDKYADGIESLFCDLENRIYDDVIRRIRKTGKITSTADWQLNRLTVFGQASDEIEDRIKNTLNLSYPEVFKLYDKVLDSEYVRKRTIYEQINSKFIPFEKNKRLRQLLEGMKRQSEDTLKNFTRSLGVVDTINGQYTFLLLTKFYQDTLDAAVMDIASGAFDYNSVLKRTVATLSKSGIRTIDYASGYSSRLPVAARRAVMTGMSQLSGKIADYNAEQLGTEHFEVAWHSGARPTHREWQGKVWSKDELVSVCGLGTVTGLLGVNCYHSYYPFISGVSERNWTDEELERLNAKEDELKTFKGKEYNAYDAKQMQRKMETSMRAQRLKVRGLEKGGADPEDIVIAKARYQGQLAEYKQFADAMDIKPHMERVYIDGLGRVAPGRKIAQQKRAKYDKLYYNKDGSLVVTNDWTGQKHASVPKEFKPFAVIDTKKHSTGQIDRSVYDEDGWKMLELHSGDHNRPKSHNYGKNGEHAHHYIWNKADGTRIYRDTQELIDKERKLIGDILCQ